MKKIPFFLIALFLGIYFAPTSSFSQGCPPPVPSYCIGDSPPCCCTSSVPYSCTSSYYFCADDYCVLSPINSPGGPSGSGGSTSGPGGSNPSSPSGGNGSGPFNPPLFLTPTNLQLKTKDPVNIATGESYFSSTDFFLKARGPKLSLARRYRSYSNINGMFGYGWRTDFDVNLTQDSYGGRDHL